MAPMFKVQNDFQEGCMINLRISGHSAPLPPAVNNSLGPGQRVQGCGASCVAPSACTNVSCNLRILLLTPGGPPLWVGAQYSCCQRPMLIFSPARECLFAISIKKFSKTPEPNSPDVARPGC
ncbi:putative neural-cadherin 2 [Chionoecetes opilio]|uniref:Putative neural-cadherin 2 n=1 Tax=Chionoecetes opilio TaxID=41210 RepID=A0A8J5D1C0_CHIOP|nr:putative neural-cadherin 2 [Chionoecetes opilio]